MKKSGIQILIEGVSMKKIVKNGMALALCLTLASPSSVVFAESTDKKEEEKTETKKEIKSTDDTASTKESIKFKPDNNSADQFNFSNVETSGNCEEVCEAFTDKEGNFAGPFDGSDWEKNDKEFDLVCAKLGVNAGAPLTPLVQPSPVGVAKGGTCQIGGGKSVDVKDFTTELTGTGASTEEQKCEMVNIAKVRCSFRQTQIGAHCKAYRLAKKAAEGDDWMIKVDAGVAATCFLAASTDLGAGPWGRACSASACIAGGMELFQTMNLEHPVGEAVNKVPLLGGINKGVGALAVFQNVADQGCGVGDTLSWKKGTAAVPESGEVTNTNGDILKEANPGSAATNGGPAFDGNKLTSKGNDRQKESAMQTAITFSILTGIRAANIGSMHYSKNSSCEAAKKLYSSVKNDKKAFETQMTKNRALASVDRDKSVTEIHDLISKLETEKTAIQANKNFSETQQKELVAKIDGKIKDLKGQEVDATRNFIDSAAATASHTIDGKAVMNGPLGPLASQQASRMDTKTMHETLKTQGAGGLIGSMLAGHSIPAEAAQALMNVAQVAQKNSTSTAALFPGLSANFAQSGAAPASNTANVGTAEGTSTSGGFFGSLFQGSNDRAPANGPQTASFGAQNPDAHIFHEGTDKNIFEIVSGKIGNVTPRVK